MCVCGIGGLEFPDSGDAIMDLGRPFAGAGPVDGEFPLVKGLFRTCPELEAMLGAGHVVGEKVGVVGVKPSNVY